MTMPVVRYESVIPKIAGAEQATHNLIDVDHTSKFSVLCTDPVGNMSSSSRTFEVLSEFVDSSGWVCSMSMEFTTASNSRQKFLMASPGRFFKY